MNYESIEPLVSSWNSAARLSNAVKYCAHKGIDKKVVVDGYKYFSKKYGYSGSVPIPNYTNKRPYADDWENLGNGLQYSKRYNIYFLNGRTYDKRSAEHNGIIGLGAILKTTINQR